MQRMKLALLTILFSVMSALAVSAANISFLHQTLDARGTIDGNVFGTSEVFIRATGDTANIQTIGDVSFIDHASAEIEIVGIGTFQLATGTRTFVNRGLDLVGFSRAGAGGSDLLNGPNNAAFGTWDMTTSIGPIAGVLNYLQWAAPSVVATTGEVIVFDNLSVEGAFTARVDDMPAVPLPAAGWMLIAGLGGLGALRKFRKS